VSRSYDSRTRNEERISTRFAEAFANVFASHTAMRHDKIVALGSAIVNQAREELRRDMQARHDAFRAEAQRTITAQVTEYTALVEALKFMLDRWERNVAGDTTSHIAELHSLLRKVTDDDQPHPN
jgi:hypothetical protein